MPGSVLGPGNPTVIQSDDNTCCILVEGRDEAPSSETNRLAGSDNCVSFPLAVVSVLNHLLMTPAREYLGILRPKRADTESALLTGVP